jgi:hypothetical protein
MRQNKGQIKQGGQKELAQEINYIAINFLK